MDDQNAAAAGLATPAPFAETHDAFAPFGQAPVAPAPDDAIAGLGAGQTLRMVEGVQGVGSLPDLRACRVCGRVFDARQPFAKCESRPDMDSLCCPHDYCHAMSPFRAGAR